MGMLGELFPGRKLRDESGEDGEGKSIGDPWDIDLDSGVIRLRATRSPASAPQPVPAPEATSEQPPAE
jgi:hypothetical protein